MKTTRIMAVAVLIVGSGVALHVAQSHQPGVTRTDLQRHEATAAAPIAATAGSAHVAPLGETVTVTTDEPIPNLPGKRLVSLVVDYAPGGRSAPHRHARSAFIYAYVLSGEIRSQVDDEPARVYRPGESWFENPGAHHLVSANASDTEPARLLAVFIVDAVDELLTTTAPQ
jgi:quercetin dioxygenase-like cupin family protein